MNSEIAWMNYQLRTRVAKGMLNANSAVAVVRRNAAQGLPLDFGWSPEEHSAAGEYITISPRTGIVTATFTDIDKGASKNLKLVPIGKGRLFIFSGSPIAGPELVTINWFCTSQESGNPFALPENSFGSLPTRFAPANCR
ncbi:MAG: pilin [Sulfuritalea sp.]|nr:pilin [Sulfuritalea sp.]